MLVTLTVTTTGLKSPDAHPKLISSLDDGSPAARRHPEQRSTPRPLGHPDAAPVNVPMVRSASLAHVVASRNASPARPPGRGAQFRWLALAASPPAHPGSHHGESLRQGARPVSASSSRAPSRWSIATWTASRSEPASASVGGVERQIDQRTRPTGHHPAGPPPDLANREHRGVDRPRYPIPGAFSAGATERRALNSTKPDLYSRSVVLTPRRRELETTDEELSRPTRGVESPSTRSGVAGSDPLRHHHLHLGLDAEGTTPPRSVEPPSDRNARNARSCIARPDSALIEYPFPAPFCPVLRVLDQRNSRRPASGDSGAPRRPGSS